MRRFALTIGMVLVVGAVGCENHPPSSPPTPPSPGPGTPVSPPTPPQGGTPIAAGRGIAVAIGLNGVDPNHYDGWSGLLDGCEPDAVDMSNIARGQNLQVTTLLTRDATRDRVLTAIHNAATQLAAGDLFVLSYSGHGGQVPDANGDEPEGLDETWCLYDGQLIDDEIYGALVEFPANVRVLVFSDSCHSGSVVRVLRTDFQGAPAERRLELNEKFMKQAAPKQLKIREFPGRAVTVRPAAVHAAAASNPTVHVYRTMPPVQSIKVYEKNKAFYDRIGAAAPREDTVQVKCSVILIAGCKDNQLSADLGTNGLFTYIVKQVWNNGGFSGDYPAFHSSILSGVTHISDDQEPAYFKLYGDPGALGRFEHQHPYTLPAP